MILKKNKWLWIIGINKWFKWYWNNKNWFKVIIYNEIKYRWFIFNKDSNIYNKWNNYKNYI